MDKKYPILFFSTADWDSIYKTNKHYVAEELSKIGYKVFFFESFGIRKPNIFDNKDKSRLYKKLTNFGHHDEFDASMLTVKDLKEKIDKGIVFYDHFADKASKNKWKNDYRLKVIENKLLPKYLIDNANKYKEWFK